MCPPKIWISSTITTDDCFLSNNYDPVMAEFEASGYRSSTRPKKWVVYVLLYIERFSNCCSNSVSKFASRTCFPRRNEQNTPGLCKYVFQRTPWKLGKNTRCMSLRNIPQDRNLSKYPTIVCTVKKNKQRTSRHQCAIRCGSLRFSMCASSATVLDLLSLSAKLQSNSKTGCHPGMIINTSFV